MRKDWVVKKLGDICLSKSAIKRAKDVYSGDSEISYIDISSIDNHRNLICNINTLRFQNAPSRAQQCVEKNDILVSLVRPNLKNIAQIDFDHNSMVASSGFCVLRVKDDIINSYFLRYYLLSDSFVIYLMNNINGINYPAVKEIDVKSYVLKIPPLQTQQQIVEELDCLTSIIEKQKKQLEELDNLAQSIFYDMFGDPIENEKGWNIEQLGNICDVRDGTHDSPKYLNYSDYVLITSKNITNGDLDFSHANYISKEDYEKINLRSKVDEGDILMAMIGTIGKPIIVKKIEQNFCIKNMALIKFKSDSLIERTYLHSYLSSDSFKELISNINIGGTQKFISLGAIRKLLLNLPPLSLQEQFASKIEAIEKQKRLIKKSIKETEDLFNSRMDYYFNDF